MESLPLHLKGCPLVCLVETPGGGREQNQQSPHWCIGGALLREKGGETQGTRTTPTSSASTALPPSTAGFTGAAFGGNQGASLWLGRQCLRLEPTAELVSSAWGRLHFSPRADRLPAPPRPLPHVGLGAGGQGQRESWSQSWPAALPSLHPIPRERACKLSRKES